MQITTKNESYGSSVQLLEWHEIHVQKCELAIALMFHQFVKYFAHKRLSTKVYHVVTDYLFKLSINRTFPPRFNSGHYESLALVLSHLVY